MRSQAPSSLDEHGPAWSNPSLREPRYSQSLERGLAILSCFTPERPVLGNSELSDILGMPPSTTYRYADTLLALGYLEQTRQSKYRLGLGVTKLGMSALNSTGLREHAHSYLEDLRRRSSLTTSIAVLDGPDIVYVDTVASFRRPNKRELAPRPGSRLPAHATAMGKLLLANLPDEAQRELLAKVKLSKRGPNTIIGKRALREELQAVKDAGIAVDIEELAPEWHAIAAGVRDETAR